MTNNDWLDEIFAGWNCFYKDDKIVDFESKTLKQQILGHIAEKYVTKQECEKRVLEARKKQMENQGSLLDINGGDHAKSK